jgi:hypothetical protein
MCTLGIFEKFCQVGDTTGLPAKATDWVCRSPNIW